MRAFTNTVENKTQAVKAAKTHRKLDMLIQGTYANGSGKSFKGCSVGCTYEPFRKEFKDLDLHKISEPVHGIPEELTRLRDNIFERLSAEDAKDWHVNFTTSISVGADLSNVINKFMYWLMTDKNGVIKYARPDGAAAIKTVAGLYKRRIKGDNPTQQEWEAAAAYAATANSAAAYAATANSAAAYAAATAAANSAAAYAKTYKKIVAKLLKIIAGEK